MESVAIKRTVRVLIAPLEMSTKRALLRAEFSNGRHDIEVPLGRFSALISAESHRIDYFTLYGLLVDRHFDADVRGKVVVDVGAHKGYYAARTLAEGAVRVDSYEPARQNVTYLERAAKGFDEWAVHAVAVGATEGEIELHLSRDSWAHSVHPLKHEDPVGVERVAVVALADALDEAAAGGLGVVAKINVEGAAGAMILGTDPPCWAAVESLWLDVEPSDPVGFDGIAGHLERCGLRRVDGGGHRHLFTR